MQTGRCIHHRGTNFLAGKTVVNSGNLAAEEPRWTLKLDGHIQIGAVTSLRCKMTTRSRQPKWFPDIRVCHLASPGMTRRPSPGSPIRFT